MHSAKQAQHTLLLNKSQVNRAFHSTLHLQAQEEPKIEIVGKGLYTLVGACSKILQQPLTPHLPERTLQLHLCALPVSSSLVACHDGIRNDSSWNVCAQQIMSDPDAPSPDDPKWAEFLHMCASRLCPRTVHEPYPEPGHNFLRNSLACCLSHLA